MTGLTQLRTWMAKSPYFALVHKRSSSDNANASVLPKLTSAGNLVAGATTRVGVGLLLNPFSVLKARYEVRLGFMSSGRLMLTWTHSMFRVICMHTRVSEARLSPLFGKGLTNCYEDSLPRRSEMHRMQDSSLYSTKA